MNVSLGVQLITIWLKFFKNRKNRVRCNPIYILLFSRWLANNVCVLFFCFFYFCPNGHLIRLSYVSVCVSVGFSVFCRCQNWLSSFLLFGFNVYWKCSFNNKAKQWSKASNAVDTVQRRSGNDMISFASLAAAAGPKVPFKYTEYHLKRHI